MSKSVQVRDAKLSRHGVVAVVGLIVRPPAVGLATSRLPRRGNPDLPERARSYPVHEEARYRHVFPAESHGETVVLHGGGVVHYPVRNDQRHWRCLQREELQRELDGLRHTLQLRFLVALLRGRRWEVRGGG